MRGVRRAWMACLLLVLAGAPAGVLAESKTTTLSVEPSSTSALLGRVTGYHSVWHKQSGLEARVLEADGGASVAWNPMSLYVVATNKGGRDNVTLVWRLPFSVRSVQRMAPSECGVTLDVRVDHVAPDNSVKGTDAAAIDVCFLDDKGALLAGAQATYRDGTFLKIGKRTARSD